MSWILSATAGSGDTSALTLEVSLVPTILAWMGALLSIFTSMILAFRPSGPSLADGLLSLVFCALLAACCPALLIFTLGALSPAGGVWLPGLDEGFLLVVLDGAAPVTALLLVGGGLLVHHAREGSASGWWRLLALPGPLLAGVGLGHGLFLTSLGAIPALEVELPARVHTGQARSFPIVVPEGWTASPLTMPRASAGEACGDAEAGRLGLRVRRSWCWEVGLDEGVSWLPLEEGNQWTWVPTTERRDQILWIIPSRQRLEGAPVSVVVGPSHDEAGLRVHEVLFKSEAGNDPWRLYGWNGQVFRQLDDPATADHTGTALADVPWAWTGDGPSMLGAPEPLLDCHVGWLPEAACGCTTTPTGEIKLPSPLLCHHRPAAGAATVASLLTTVLTGGLVILDPQVETTWMLRSASREKAP